MSAQSFSWQADGAPVEVVWRHRWASHFPYPIDLTVARAIICGEGGALVDLMTAARFRIADIGERLRYILTGVRCNLLMRDHLLVMHLQVNAGNDMTDAADMFICLANLALEESI